MANQKKSTTAKTSQKTRKKKNKGSFGGKLLIVALSLGAIYFCISTFLGGLVNQGGQIDEDIRTAEELQDKVVNILVAGIDWEEDRSSANTDVLVYVTLDVENKKVSALQIPRDVYVGEDTGSRKINGVYMNGKDNNKINNLAKVINEKLGLTVDHYATLDMEGFIRMVDGIDGGLRMYVPCPIVLKDKTTGKEETIIEEAGWYYVSGELAEQIVRNRNYKGSADTMRLEVQQYFYASLIKYFSEELNVSDFIKIMNRFTQYLTTDMHWTRIASLAQFGFSVDFANIKLIKPDVKGYDVIINGNKSATNILVAEKENWAEILNNNFRPYQDAVPADKLGIPGTPPQGEIVRDYGVVKGSEKTIRDILGKTQQ